MSFNLIRAIAQTENDDDIHLGRILLLLLAADKQKKKNKAIEGITKLAKLDFLLRYPNCLERALIAENKNPDLAKVLDYERTTIESKMIRFKYGPWDARYRRWLNILASCGLITIEIVKKTILIDITDDGRIVAEKFATNPDYKDLTERSEVVIKYFGGKTASGIKDFVYRVFPELEDMKWGEDILL